MNQRNPPKPTKHPTEESSQVKEDLLKRHGIRRQEHYQRPSQTFLKRSLNNSE